MEGALALVFFVIFTAFLPRSPKHTAPLHGRWDIFSNRERFIMQSRVIEEDETKADDKAHMTLRNLMGALLNYWLWLHMILNIVSLAPKGGLQLYGPTIIKSLGFSKINANLLNAVSSVLIIILSYLISIASDKTHLRGPWCIAAYLWSIACGRSIQSSSGNRQVGSLYRLYTVE